MRTIYISIIILLIYSPARTQDYASKWHIKPAYGANIPLTKMPSHGITDHLIEYQNPNSYAQLIAATWYFKKQWGISFRHQSLLTKKIYGRDENFIQEIESTYDKDYYVTASTGASYPGPALFGGLGRTFFGLTYRYEQNDWFINPEFSFGTASFYTDWGKAFLKKKNSNEVFLISYGSEKIANDFLLLALSTAAGYKLSKHFYLNVDLMGSWHPVNVTFEKEFTNLNTNFSSTETIQYKKQIISLSGGVGFFFVM